MPQLYVSPQSAFDYDDIILIPRQGIVKSRSEIDVSTEFGGKTFNLPIVPANMSTIVDAETCLWLAEQGYFYVMHRFDINAFDFTKWIHEKGQYSSASLGIKEADYQIVDRMVKEKVKPEYITIDVAHGDSLEVVKMVEYLKNKLPQTFLIVGNVGTSEGAGRLAEAGADAVKVGIGPGAACLTSPNTGFGTQIWQLGAVANIAIALEGSNVKIVADGGLRKYGDVAKSIAFGADMVMIGSMLAGHDENPGELLEIDGELKKAYFGSASEHQKGEHKYVEGQKLFVPYKGSLKTTLQIFKENLQSSVSYAGGQELLALREVNYVRK